MDTDHFDTLLHSLSTTSSRRGALLLLRHSSWQPAHTPCPINQGQDGEEPEEGSSSADGAADGPATGSGDAADGATTQETTPWSWEYRGQGGDGGWFSRSERELESDARRYSNAPAP